HDVPGLGPFPSSGLLVQVGDQLVLIDTAWTDPQTEQLADEAAQRLGAEIDTLIVTHAHYDKMGGVAVLNDRGVRTLAIAITNEAATTRDLVPTRETLQLDAEDSARLADGAIEVFYPGPGHTDDNVVVYLRDSKVLFGGCMIRPGESDSLGNTADADIDRWDQSVQRVMERYPDATVVVPSHGPPAGPELLGHTIELVTAHRAAAAEQ
ncbi:MAG TPA: subclass B1 metallo-beta-lactamase, partial [Enhygromyxa sp.]|nr:subclass B1 metallo-beta-lactamase [Enhygromyxa sp.]